MSDIALLENPALEGEIIQADEPLDEDTLMQMAQADADEVDVQLQSWIPTEYVLAITGPRGSGKSILMAYFLKNGLQMGYDVFTNLEMYPDRMHTDNAPMPLNLNHLLSFDPSLKGAVVGIEELPTWISSKRAMATSNILVDNWMQQLRKRNLRISFTQQSPYMPQGILDQVDAIIYSHDLFFSPWAEESNLARGTSFYYWIYDKSGAFTHRPGKVWGMALLKAHNLWRIYNSFQAQDPLQLFRKVRVVGEDTIIDMDEGEAFGADELCVRKEQKALREYDILLRKEWQDLESGFLQWAWENEAIIEDQPNAMAFSVTKMRTAMTKLKGKKREQIQNDYNKLRSLATNSPVARFQDGRAIIELHKPIQEEIIP